MKTKKYKFSGKWKVERGMRNVCCRVSSLLFPLSSFLFLSCSLDENPRDQIPEEEAYADANALFRNTVATLYNYIGGATDGQGLQGTEERQQSPLRLGHALP